jgi:hypothetical protein
MYCAVQKAEVFFCACTVFFRALKKIRVRRRKIFVCAQKSPLGFLPFSVENRILICQLIAVLIVCYLLSFSPGNSDF